MLLSERYSLEIRLRFRIDDDYMSVNHSKYLFSFSVNVQLQLIKIYLVILFYFPTLFPRVFKMKRQKAKLAVFWPFSRKIDLLSRIVNWGGHWHKVDISVMVSMTTSIEDNYSSNMYSAVWVVLTNRRVTRVPSILISDPRRRRGSSSLFLSSYGLLAFTFKKFRDWQIERELDAQI